MEILKNIHESSMNQKHIIKKGVSGIDISKKIELKELIIKKERRGIGGCDDLPFDVSYTINHPYVYAYKQGYIKLGLLMFELLFSSQPYIECTITHKDSEIKQLFFALSREEYGVPFLQVKEPIQYKHFMYYPSEIGGRYGFNWSEDEIELNYSCSRAEDRLSENFVEKADQLVVETTVQGLLNLAELFFNIGRKENQQTEICLENPLYGGVGGVNKRSMEISFWLPGSLAFYGDNIDLLF